MTPPRHSVAPRRGASQRPRRIRLPFAFYGSAAFYVALSLCVFLGGAYMMLSAWDNTSYVVVGSFLILVLISNLLSKKFIRLLRRYGTQ